MALRKMNIPFKNFLKNTVISSTQMNDDLQEVEYTFNELFDAFDERTKDTYSKDEVDNLQTNMDSKLVEMIGESHIDNEHTSTNVYDSMINLTDVEVSDSAQSGMLNPTSDGFISDYELSEILGFSKTSITNIDMGTFGENSIEINGGEF